MNQIEQTQNDIEALIREIESFSAPIHLKAKEYNQMYSGVGMSNPWDAEIKPYLDGFIVKYRYEKELYSHKALLKIKENLNFVANIIMGLNHTLEDKLDLESGIKLLNETLAEINLNLDNFYEYNIDKILSKKEFDFLLQEISKTRTDIKNSLNKISYENLNESFKLILSRNISNIYNKLNSTEEENDTFSIKNSIDNIDMIIQWASLDNKYNELYQKAIQVSEKITAITVNPINTGYEQECIKLNQSIEDLNKKIINLFKLLILAFLIKILVLLTITDMFNNIYMYLTFISLIISISALTAYFIKDRKKLMLLHDHYKLNVLELSTLPNYMGELDDDQRKQLYIDLSHNFFRGSVPNQENNKNSNSELDGLSKSIAELSKIVSNLKGIIK